MLGAILAEWCPQCRLPRGQGDGLHRAYLDREMKAPPFHTMMTNTAPVCVCPIPESPLAPEDTR